MQFEIVPPVCLGAIRARAQKRRRGRFTKWSTLGIAIAALLVFAFAPAGRSHQPVPASIPAPQPTIT